MTSRSLLVLLVVFGASAAARGQTPQALVSVYGTRDGGNTIYHYAVKNAGAGEILRLYLGCARLSSADPDVPELQALPIGASAVRTDEFGTWYELAAAAVARPAGWRARLLRPHGARGHCIEWQAPGPGQGISTGTTASGFAVSVAGADESYLWSRFAAATGAATVEGVLERADVVPPKISISGHVAPGPSEAKATVRLEPVATDDRDPQPLVILESLERAADGTGYIARYAAIDASGNRASAEFRLDLPGAARAGAPARLLPLASLP
ncbi:MAG TPA: hypothetical protein VF203_13305 [Burkholderiales bacterium]